MVSAQTRDDLDSKVGWHRGYTQELQGANIMAALDYLNQRGMTPQRQVVVGIVDSGIDTTNVSLKSALWLNPGEIAGDGQDNDGNGYVDDLHGWNFLGTQDGSFNMTSAGTEEYRQFKRLFPKYKNVTSRDSAKDKKEYDFYIRMRRKAKIDQYLSYYEAANRSRDNLDSLSLTRLAEMEKNIYGIEHDTDKRLLMGDDMEDADDRFYGNPTLTIDGCEHGTFVAGIIGGDALDDHRYDGIATGMARLMIIRASPEGDEYDKDIATSIRYAVDNGASVINISLGKYYSPQERMVNNAIRYALDHDVVVVHAAGNNGLNLDTVSVYPSGLAPSNHFFTNFIRVGSTDELGRVAQFSNRGQQTVHLFAPGTYIASIMPGNKYSMSQGTSLSAPVVTAIVALLRSYFPYLKAPQICQLLMETVQPMAEQVSISGGMVDMLAAVKRIVEQPIDWYRAESVGEKYVSGLVYRLGISPSWIDDTPFLTYEHQGKKYMVDARTGKTSSFDQKLIDDYKRRNKTAGKPSRHRLSYGHTAHTADSLYTMLGDRFNLYVRNNQTGEVRQLTTDGREYASYCYQSARDTLREGNASGSWRGHTYFDLIYDDTEVSYLNLVHTLVTPPRLEQKKMPLPGNGTRRFRLYWYNADTGEGRLLPITTQRDQFVQLDYEKSDDYLWFLRRSRTVDTLQLCRIDVRTGDVKVLITEECKPHINVNMFKYHLLDQGRRILWWSERTGRGNYYLYDGEGRLLNRVTQGDQLVAGRIEKIDTTSQTLIFLGYGQEKDVDPNYTDYYKVNLNGKNQQLLTYGNGQHELTLSPDSRYAIDRYSRMDMPWRWNVVDVRNPKNHHEFFHVSEADAMQTGWVKPTLIKVKAADGQTDLYGVMYLPSTLDRETKLPIISNVYPGPQDDQIPRAFAVDENQSLAELGFVVINVQPRGSSPLRGRDFYCYGYGNLRDYPVADDRHTIETLASQYPFIDLDRVGIYGHSGGGFETVAAMLNEPDFYKVGVSASGNHDNSVYIQWWADTYHGYGQPIPTNMELADRLKGRLLLISGEVDENVPIASTYRLADALQKAGKRFDMMILPGQGHGLYGDYYQNLIRYYFLEHLVCPKAVEMNIVEHK